jgi:hypothetical protein
MDAIFNFLKQPFAWGLCLGLLFFALSAWAHFKTKRELARYRKHLSDKLELEARQIEMIRKDKESLTKENEHLRVRVQQLMDKPDQKIARDLEILARAEKRLMVQAPGFAAAWEAAKSSAADELSGEDAGKSLPRRIFNRLFGTGSVREADVRMLAADSAASPPPSASTAASSAGGTPSAAADSPGAASATDAVRA